MQVSGQPDGWTDGSFFPDDVSGASSSGSVFYSHLPGVREGGVILMNLVLLVVWVAPVAVFALCLVLQFWGAVLALQASRAVHLGVDNLNLTT